MKARGADSPGVERVPFMPTIAGPAVFLARRPTAEWASDARAGGFVALVLNRLAINNRLVIFDGTHASIL